MKSPTLEESNTEVQKMKQSMAATMKKTCSMEVAKSYANLKYHSFSHIQRDMADIIQANKWKDFQSYATWVNMIVEVTIQ